MKIGFFGLPMSGHLNPMTALARKLQSRGHDVVFFSVPDVEPIVHAANLTFIPFGEKQYPVGSMLELFAPVAKLHGEEVLRVYLEQIAPAFLKVVLDSLPEKLAGAGLDALVTENVNFFGLIPMSLGIPFVQVWNSLHLDVSGTTPVCLFSWPPETTPEARTRNIQGLKKIASYAGPTMAVIKSYAEKVGFEIDWSNRTATTSKLAVITQTPREFDFPDIPWSAEFRYAGPFHDDQGREPIPFPWEKLTGEPLIYASLGTYVNDLEQIYKTILAVAQRLSEVQVVLSVGKNVDPDDLGPIPSNTIVVRTAPQIELLKRAALCITHAGLNTALECLGQGVPMVAIPIANDQPGVAARIAYHGVGEFIEVDDLTQEGLAQSVLQVMKTPAYRDKALYFQDVITNTRGLDVAADEIELAFRSNN